MHRAKYGGNSSPYGVFMMGFPGCSVVKDLLASAGDKGLMPGSGRSGSPFQHSCLGNPMD